VIAIFCLSTPIREIRKTGKIAYRLDPQAFFDPRNIRDIRLDWLLDLIGQSAKLLMTFFRLAFQACSRAIPIRKAAPILEHSKNVINRDNFADFRKAREMALVKDRLNFADFADNFADFPTARAMALLKDLRNFADFADAF
jgi:hypothetical protein